MALEARVLEARDERHQSPVDVILCIRKELAEFQKAGAETGFDSRDAAERIHYQRWR